MYPTLSLPIAVAAALQLAAGAAWASSTLDSRAENVAAQQTAVSKFLETLAASNGDLDGEALRTRMGRLALIQPPMPTKTDLEAAGHSPHAANHILGTMGLVAALAAATVGTALQGAQAALLSEFSGLLAGNGNPKIEQEAALLAQESNAVDNGDGPGAAAIARQFSGISGDLPAPNYIPAATDAAVEATMSQVGAWDWANVFMALGKSLMAGLLGSLQGGAFGGLAAMASSLIAAAVNGSFTSDNLVAVPAQAAQSRSSGQNAGSQQGPNAVLSVPSGASGIQMLPGQGSAAGGALVGARQYP